MTPIVFKLPSGPASQLRRKLVAPEASTPCSAGQQLGTATPPAPPCQPFTGSWSGWRDPTPVKHVPGEHCQAS